MNKEKFVKSLNNVKLIIGNGFDLHCGLHTKYSDFYCKNIDKYLFINELFGKYESTKTLYIEDERIDDLNTWDIFFALNSSKNPNDNKQLWCDIERLLLSSFTSSDIKKTRDVKKLIEGTAIYIVSKIHWDEIRNYVVKNSLATNYESRFLVEFIRYRMNYLEFFPGDFYQFLLSELKKFELDFGKFIYSQLHLTWYEYCNHGREFICQPYVKMAMDTIDELCNRDNLVAIDSFNYGDIREETIAQKLQNINGDLGSPIFGIDSIFEPKDDRFVFTKTGRRIDSDLFGYSYEAKPEFENIIIYGHSLNEADYSYFFPVFDRIKLTDTLASNVIVFAYSIYDKDREESIKSDLRDAMSKLLYTYAVDKQLPNPKRFLDSLSTQKRIITYEIPTLQREKYGYSIVDQEWKKIYDKVDKISKQE